MFDLILFSVGQKKPITEFKNNYNIYITSEVRYAEYWRFLALAEGTWYTLYADENEYAGTRICEHRGYENQFTALPGIDQTISECLTPYQIDKEFLSSFRSILDQLIEASPIKQVYVLASYQSSEKEVVIGCYKPEKFFSLMDENKIYANICYIISKQPNSID